MCVSGQSTSQIKGAAFPQEILGSTMLMEMYYTHFFITVPIFTFFTVLFLIRTFWVRCMTCLLWITNSLHHGYFSSRFHLHNTHFKASTHP